MHNYLRRAMVYYRHVDNLRTLQTRWHSGPSTKLRFGTRDNNPTKGGLWDIMERNARNNSLRTDPIHIDKDFDRIVPYVVYTDWKHYGLSEPECGETSLGRRFHSLRKVISNDPQYKEFQEHIVSHSGGESVSEVIFNHLDNSSARLSAVSQIHTRFAKRIALQAIIGVESIHRSGITHGGLGIDKLRFFDEWETEPVIRAVNQMKGRQVLNPDDVPLYLDPDLYSNEDLERNIKVCGAEDAFMETYDHRKLRRPFPWSRGYPEAPEISGSSPAIGRIQLNYRIDLWDLGFLIWQLFAGIRIFYYQSDEFLGSLMRLTGGGPPPDWLEKLRCEPLRKLPPQGVAEEELKVWETERAATKYKSIKELFKQSYKEPSWEEYYGPSWDEDYGPGWEDYYSLSWEELYGPDCEDYKTDKENDIKYKEKGIDKYCSSGLTPEDVEIVGDIVESLIKINPRERVKADKILENEWWSR